MNSWRLACLGALAAVGLSLGGMPPGMAGLALGVPTPQGDTPQPAWLEVQPGQLPIILSAPHGGELMPPDIPDRKDAIVVDDEGSLQFTRDLADALETLTGRRPYVILNHLHRSKLDPNRSLALGAQGNPAADAAWTAYHEAIARADLQVTAACGWGLYVDLHSNGEPVPSVQFGYGLTVEDLDRDDEALSARQYALRSNLRSLAVWSSMSLADLVRGPQSLGGRMEAHGYRVYPSPQHPVPEAGYFDGGISVALHGSRRGGAIDATQIEVPYSLLDEPRRAALARWLATALIDFMDQAYAFDLGSRTTPVCSGFADVGLGDWAGASIARLAQARGLPACAASPRRLCPSESLTRAETAVAAWRLLTAEGLPRITEGPDPFADLPADASQAASIRGLQAMGALQPCAVEPARFCPQSVETRAEAAFMGMKLLSGREWLPPPPSGIFTDAPAGQWSTWWVEAAYASGLLLPCRQNALAVCADEPISRQDFAWLIDHALPSASP